MTYICCCFVAGSQSQDLSSVDQRSHWRLGRLRRGDSSRKGRGRGSWLQTSNSQPTGHENRALSDCLVRDARGKDWKMSHAFSLRCDKNEHTHAHTSYDTQAYCACFEARNSEFWHQLHSHKQRMEKGTNSSYMKWKGLNCVRKCDLLLVEPSVPLLQWNRMFDSQNGSKAGYVRQAVITKACATDVSEEGIDHHI